MNKTQILGGAIAAAVFLVGCLWIFDLEARVGRLESELTVLRADHGSNAALVKQLHHIEVTIPEERRKTNEIRR